MSDALLFYKLGWQGIWKQKTIFLYYAVFLFANQFSPYFNYLQDNFLWLRCFLIPFTLLIVPVSLIAGSIGEIFISHKITQSEPLIFNDIFQLIKKHFWRFTKLFILIGFITILFWIPSYLLQYGIDSFEVKQYYFLFALVSSSLLGLWFFIFAEFLIKNKGVFKSISDAWKLFSKNLAVLTAMGIISFGIWYIPNLIIVVIFEYVQPDFSFNALSRIDFLFPGTLLKENLAYLLTIYTITIFSRAFAVTSFIYAYNRYSPREGQTGKKITRKLSK
jgi:hypothetical protein